MTITATDRITLAAKTVARLADDVLEVTFEHPSGETLPAWQPGAHIEVQLPSGLTRPYSLCGDPGDTSTYTIAVLREKDGRGGSREFHEIAQTGLQLSVRLPKNEFHLVEAQSYLFIGGGIGITPLIPMIADAQHRGCRWTLVYGGRSDTSMAYRERLQHHGYRVDVWVEADRGYPDLPAILAAAPAGTLVYTCGPGAMIDAVVAEFANHGHLGGLHFERFGATSPVDFGGDAFEVELRRTGVTLRVPEGCPILQEVVKILPDHPFSCEEGYCGECETRVLEGTPDHRDEYLTEEEQEQGDVMMICVSRCRGERLVLDL
jgi:ferredoxin-NADP reductase